MQINADQLSGQLRRGLAPLYLVSGDEPLLVAECAEAVRAAAQAAGYTERQVLTVEPGFDWDGLYAATQALSLFSERRVLDLRLPSGKPGDTGSKTLIQIAAELPADILLLVTTAKLDKQARQAKWVKTLESRGVAVVAYPVEAAQLPGWIGRRLRAKGLEPGPDVAELLAHHMEGNLLACAQEIDKLGLLLGTGKIGVDDIEGVLCDNARFNVFTLADACLRGEWPAILRILRTLRAEGVEPVLVLWSLVREARELAAMTHALSTGQSESQVLEAHRVWPRRRPLVKQALKRLRFGDWLQLLQRAARTDRVIKGRQRGDAWHDLERLALAIGGMKLVFGHESQVSGW